MCGMCVESMCVWRVYVCDGSVYMEGMCVCVCGMCVEGMCVWRVSVWYVCVIGVWKVYVCDRSVYMEGMCVCGMCVEYMWGMCV